MPGFNAGDFPGSGLFWFGAILCAIGGAIIAMGVAWLLHHLMFV